MSKVHHSHYTQVCLLEDEEDADEGLEPPAPSSLLSASPAAMAAAAAAASGEGDPLAAALPGPVEVDEAGDQDRTVEVRAG